jgi:hypothetical protein
MDYWLEGGTGIEGISVETTRFSAMLPEEARENVQQFVRRRLTTTTAHRGYDLAFGFFPFSVALPKGSIIGPSSFACFSWRDRKSKRLRGRARQASAKNNLS